MTKDVAVIVPEIRRASRSQTALFFGVSLPTIDAWLRRECPIAQPGSRGVAAVFDLRAVAEWRATHAPAPVAASGDDPNTMPPRERRDWWSSEEIRLRTEVAQGRLVHADDMTAVVGNALASVRAHLLSHHSTVASLYPDLPIDSIRHLQQLNKKLLAELAGTPFPGPLRDEFERLAEDSKTIHPIEDHIDV